MHKSEIHLGPWMRGQWNGQFVSVDGTSTADFTYDDVSDVIICCEEEYSGYDGTSFGIVKLTDGRYISWETTWGPTGNGFSADAYSGDADIYCSMSMKAMFFYLSESARAKIAEELGL
jgi:hypothetical protein